MYQPTVEQRQTDVGGQELQSKRQKVGVRGELERKAFGAYGAQWDWKYGDKRKARNKAKEQSLG